MAPVSTSNMGPELAIDGRHEPEAFSKPYSCSEAKPDWWDWAWWYLDLGESYDIREVLVLARQNAFSNEYVEVIVTDLFQNAAEANPDNYTLCDVGELVTGRVTRFICTSEASGRYVIIRRITKRKYGFSICEVEVYSRNSFENLAARKSAQFRVGGNESNLVPALAVDSSRQTEPDSYYNSFYSICAVSDNAKQNWWHVDLAKLHHIRKVIVVASATPLADYRMSYLEGYLTTEFHGQLIKPTDFGVKFLFRKTGLIGFGEHFLILTNEIGRHVVIQQGLDQPSIRLALCEVEVYGNPLIGENLALGRRIMVGGDQWYGPESGTVVSPMLDGRRDTEYTGSSSSNVDFIVVDLSGWFNIKTVVLITGSNGIGKLMSGGTG
ncbi:uncharacterized protein LOC141908415 [Tubulanus polymorphus]|uniref:uncharacterized protein LOC141908415 n=1 Tax=Tubulanus polymorphus TaxID=672921 RepID=UPI003DA20ABD